METKDVTSKVEFGWPDEECLPITKCACGKTFSLWSEILSVYPDPNYAWTCHNCGRKLYFKETINVYEVTEKEENE